MSLTLADATVVRPFGLPGASDLVVLRESDPARPSELIEISPPKLPELGAAPRFGGSAAVVGQSIFIDNEDHRIIGVMRVS